MEVHLNTVSMFNFIDQLMNKNVLIQQHCVTYKHLLYKAEKPSVRLSSFFPRHADNSVISVCSALCFVSMTAKTSAIYKFLFINF